MASPTAPTISATGISAPTFADVLAYLQAQYRSIFGADIYLGNDSQDGQFIGIIAAAINDSNAAAVACYNAFSPATAQGNNLSSAVKTNGISRLVASYSTVDLTIVGVAGTTINNGIVSDANSNSWLLPASVVIPLSGSITVTATCSAAGSIAAAVGTVTKISTPVYGWQSVTNAAAASQGAPVESDAALRVRQGQSVAIPSLTILEGIAGAVESLAGVSQVRAYENDTNATDSNGIPEHSIVVVVLGGDSTSIANAISAKKTPGAYTHGTTSATVTDNIGIAHVIRFFRPTDAPVSVAITIKALSGYSTAVGDQIKQSIADYINSTAIGGGASGCVEWDYSITAAKSAGTSFKVASLALTGLHGAGSPDVSVLFNEKASCAVASITLTVT
jgi:uncharacterized phage protein gp47/JayE